MSESEMQLPFARDRDRAGTMLEVVRELEYLERDPKEVTLLHVSQIEKVRTRLDELLDIMGDPTRTMEERGVAYDEADAIRTSLEDLFIRQRFHKILLNIWGTVYSNVGDGTEGMLDCEKVFYEKTLAAALELKKAVGC